jgi:hypothetical protein
MEVNPLLKYDTSVPSKYYTGTVESQERIEGFWSSGTLGGREALKHRGTREHREEGGKTGGKDEMAQEPCACCALLE